MQQLPLRCRSTTSVGCPNHPTAASRSREASVGCGLLPKPSCATARAWASMGAYATRPGGNPSEGHGLGHGLGHVALVPADW